jgi:hypothetical protein
VAKTDRFVSLSLLGTHGKTFRQSVGRFSQILILILFHLVTIRSNNVKKCQLKKGPFFTQWKNFMVILAGGKKMQKIFSYMPAIREAGKCFGIYILMNPCW